MRYAVKRCFWFFWTWQADEDRGGARGLALSRRGARWAARAALRDRDAADGTVEGDTGRSSEAA